MNKIIYVEKGSIGDELGIEAGDIYCCPSMVKL